MRSGGFLFDYTVVSYGVAVYGVGWLNAAENGCLGRALDDDFSR